MARYSLLLILFACSSSLLAAPAPKDKAKVTAPDLGAMFERVGTIAKGEKWPKPDEETALVDTVKDVVQRMLKAAGKKERSLPVAIEGLQKLVVEGQSHVVSRESQFVIAGSTRSTGMKKCIVFANEIQSTSAEDCILVGKTVRCTSIKNCVVVAEEWIQLTIAKDGECVFCAGQWIRANQLANVLCHVVNPGIAPGPANLVGRDGAAIRCNGGKDSIFLNDKSNFKATSAENCEHLTLTEPIARLGKR